LRRIVVTLIVTAAAFGLAGCLSPAAQQAPNDTVLRCQVLRGQGAGSSFETDKATVIAQGLDTSPDVYCDIAQ